MGIFSMLKDALTSGAFKEKKVSIEAKCPKCKTKITTDMERCPGCGTHVSSMFKLECPECGEKNDVSSTVCKKCGMEFTHKEEEGERKVSYRCPRCGYNANYYMLSCPACGVKFV